MKPWRPRDAVIIAAILVVALATRLIEAARSPFSFDEIYGLLLARMGPAGIFRVLRLDVDQPLGFLAIWGWRAIGGEGALWLKLFFVLCGLLTVLAAIGLGRALFGPRAGLLAGALLAANPTHIFYSQQASYPVLVWLLLTLAAWSAWRWVEGGGAANAAAFVALSGLAMFTYYFSAFVVGAIVLWGALRLDADRRRQLQWLGLALAIAALCAPGVPLLIWQLNRDIFGDLTLRGVPPGDLVDLVRKLSDNSILLAVPMAALALLPLFRAAEWRNASLLWFTMLAPVIVTFIMSVEGIHLFILRQWLYTLPLWCVLVGAGLSALRWKPLAAVLGIALVAIGLRAWHRRGAFEEGRLLSGLETRIAREARPGDLVVCAETRALLFLHYHLPRLERLRLLVMRDEEPFHYSDGILAVPDSWRMSERDWRAAVGRGERWWGVRLGHAGRDGPRAAAAFDSLARGGAWRLGKITLWQGAPADTAAPAPGARAGGLRVQRGRCDRLVNQARCRGQVVLIASRPRG